MFAIALALLFRGSLRAVSLVYMSVIWLVATIQVVLNGGIRSPFMVFYLALPISAAWLLGYRAALLVGRVDGPKRNVTLSARRFTASSDTLEGFDGSAAEPVPIFKECVPKLSGTSVGWLGSREGELPCNRPDSLLAAHGTIGLDPPTRQSTLLP
jgi:hypothetical protein